MDGSFSVHQSICYNLNSYLSDSSWRGLAIIKKIYLGSTGACVSSSQAAVMTENGSAPTTGGTLSPDSTVPLQHMTTGEDGGGAVSITLDIPAVTATAGTKIELWITANSETTLDISEYVIPSGSTLVSPVVLLAGETYIFLLKKGLITTWDWNLVSYVGGYKLELT